MPNTALTIPLVRSRSLHARQTWRTIKGTVCSIKYNISANYDLIIVIYYRNINIPLNKICSDESLWRLKVWLLMYAVMKKYLSASMVNRQ